MKIADVDLSFRRVLSGNGEGRLSALLCSSGAAPLDVWSQEWLEQLNFPGSFGILPQ